MALTEGVAMIVKTGDASRGGRPATRTSRRGSGAGGEQLSRADRAAKGKDARKLASLESQAEFRPGKGRDPVGLLLGQPAGGQLAAALAWCAGLGVVSVMLSRVMFRRRTA